MPLEVEMPAPVKRSIFEWVRRRETRSGESVSTGGIRYSAFSVQYSVAGVCVLLLAEGLQRLLQFLGEGLSERREGAVAVALVETGGEFGDGLIEPGGELREGNAGFFCIGEDIAGTRQRRERMPESSRRATQARAGTRK